MHNEEDRKEVERIRRKVNSDSGYGSEVEGVHTWDVATIFDDMRTLLRIAAVQVKEMESERSRKD